MQKSWSVRKATCLSQAWNQQFGAWPTLHAVLFGLAQATAETVAGDAWPGPDGILDTPDDIHNWGATNLRALNPAELAALHRAGVVPSVGRDHEERASAAMAVLRAAGLPIPNGEIHCDSAPGVGAYFVWFAKFSDYDRVLDDGTHEHVSGDVAGARYYLRIACGSLGKLKALYSVMCNPAGTLDQHCRTAFAQHYYTGTSKDPEKDIAAYEAFMGRPLAALKPLISDFDPSACEPIPEPVRSVLSRGDVGEDVRHAQEWMVDELAALHSSPDGTWGKDTDAACPVWRVRHGLSGIAQWDDDCRRAVYAAAPDPVMQRASTAQFADWKGLVEDQIKAEVLAADLNDSAGDAATTMGPREG